MPRAGVHSVCCGWLQKALPFAAVLALWWALSEYGNNARIIPPPVQVAGALLRLLVTADAWLDIGCTLWRGGVGLALALVLAVVCGVACGRRPRVLDALSPLVILGQGCPPVVWISLLLVWCSVGHAVPVAVVVISVFPALFLNVAGSTAALDVRFFEVARLYRVPFCSRLRKLILPGIAPTVAPALSYSVGIAWKVTATAEFFGASRGIGARIYQSFRLLDLPELFAWSLFLALCGVAVHTLVLLMRNHMAKAGFRKK